MKEAYDFLVKKSGISYKDTVVVGVSGGPDSMALLHLMNEIKREMDLFLICAHVNHNVRPESENEKAFLQKYCDDQGIYFEYMKIENYGDDNFHNEARTIRYNFFEKIAKQYGAKFVLTAHHADDLIETILMRIVRGSTLKGYSGFSRIVDKGDYKVLRPLITITKKDLIKYDKKHNIKYVIDNSNTKEIYTRNRYRKYVLPFFKSEDVNVHLKFLKFSETLLESNEYIEKQMLSIINKVFKQGVLDVEKFKELEKIMQLKIINNILEKIYGDDLLIVSDVHVNLIINLINSNKPNSLIHLPNNVIVTKAYNEVSFSFSEDVEENYEIEINDLVNLPNGKNIELVRESQRTDNNVIRLNSKEVALPLYVRTRRTGDKIEVKGMIGSKKVNNIFIDSKISTRERNLWPIVCDAQDKIVWIPGLKKSRFDKDKNQEYDIILKYY